MRKPDQEGAKAASVVAAGTSVSSLSADLSKPAARAAVELAARI